LRGRDALDRLHQELRAAPEERDRFGDEVGDLAAGQGRRKVHGVGGQPLPVFEVVLSRIERFVRQRPQPGGECLPLALGIRPCGVAEPDLGKRPAHLVRCELDHALQDQPLQLLHPGLDDAEREIVLVRRRERPSVVRERGSQLVGGAQRDLDRRRDLGGERPGLGRQSRHGRCQRCVHGDIDAAPDEAARVVHAEAREDPEAGAGLEPDARLGGDGEAGLSVPALEQAPGGDEVRVGHGRGGDLRHDAALDREFVQEDGEEIRCDPAEPRIGVGQIHEVADREADVQLHAGGGLGDGLQAYRNPGLIEQVERYLDLAPDLHRGVGMPAEIHGEVAPQGAI
jgi:hypothetical protein